MSTQVSIPMPAYIGNGQILAVSAKGMPIALTKVGDEWRAFDDFCTHAGCSFSGSGIIENGIVVCNCHGAEFSLKTGAPLGGIAYEAIAVYPVQATEKTLEITVP